MRTLERSPAPRRTLLLTGTLLILCAGLAHAEETWGGRDPQRRDAMLRERAEAMSRLSSRQRQDYFAALRSMEQRQSSARLDQLSQAERCLEQARGVPAVETCQRSMQEQKRQLRRQRMAELRDLQSRFNLPSWQPRQQRQGA
jgi:hypothetical protein